MNLKLKGNARSGNIEHWHGPHGQNISPAIIIPIDEFQYFLFIWFCKECTYEII